MAYIFLLAVECGRDETLAYAIKAQFADIQGTFSDGTAMGWAKPDLSIEEREGIWWFFFLPMGVGTIQNVPDIRGLQRRSEMVQYVYSVLQPVSGFRFAFLGWEIVGDLSFEELLAARENLEKIPKSTVLGREAWLALGAPNEFQPFGPGTYRRKLDSADYREITLLFSGEV